MTAQPRHAPPRSGSSGAGTSGFKPKKKNISVNGNALTASTQNHYGSLPTFTPTFLGLVYDRLHRARVKTWSRPKLNEVVNRWVNAWTGSYFYTSTWQHEQFTSLLSYLNVDPDATNRRAFQNAPQRTISRKHPATRDLPQGAATVPILNVHIATADAARKATLGTILLGQYIVTPMRLARSTSTVTLHRFPGSESSHSQSFC